MNISLPDQMKEWVEQSVATGRYANASDYVRALIRKDREYREKLAAMQAAITKGLESGVSDQTIDEIWDDVKARHAEEV